MFVFCSCKDRWRDGFSVSICLARLIVVVIIIIIIIIIFHHHRHHYRMLLTAFSLGVLEIFGPGGGGGSHRYHRPPSSFSSLFLQYTCALGSFALVDTNGSNFCKRAPSDDSRSTKPKATLSPNESKADFGVNICFYCFCCLLLSLRELCRTTLTPTSSYCHSFGSRRHARGTHQQYWNLLQVTSGGHFAGQSTK